MWSIRRIDPFDLVRGVRYVSFTGAGGKTGLSEYLAALALRQGLRPVITTTTKIYAREPYVLKDGSRTGPFSEGRFVRFGADLREGKLTGIGFDDVERLGECCDLVLVEADGAKGKPLKYPSGNEPLVPPVSEKVFVVTGLDGLSGTVRDVVFRWETYSRASGVAGDEKVTTERYRDLFRDEALLKGVPRQRCLIVLNKYDACPVRADALFLAKMIIDGTGGIPVLISSLPFGVFYMVDYIP